MTVISDEGMRQALTKTRVYSVVILLAGPKRHEPQIETVIWEHGRRNFELRAEGKLSIACPSRTEAVSAGWASSTPTLKKQCESWMTIRA